MIIFVLVFLHEAAAAIVTAAGCWLALRCHRRAGWYLAILGAIIVAAIEVLYPDGGFVFHPERFEHSKTSPAIVFQGFLFMVGIAVIPALFVVRYYRKKFRDYAEHVA